jgi:predicted transcriptional regulator
MEQNPAKTAPATRRVAREARTAAKRAVALALRKGGATYVEIGVELGVCLERARRIVVNAERLTEQPRWFDALPTRAATFLRLRGLSELPEVEAALAVAKLTRREIKTEPNFGRGALAALEAWLASHGLALRNEIQTANKKRAPAEGALLSSTVGERTKRDRPTTRGLRPPDGFQKDVADERPGP